MLYSKYRYSIGQNKHNKYINKTKFSRILSAQKKIQDKSKITQTNKIGNATAALFW